MMFRSFVITTTTSQEKIDRLVNTHEDDEAYQAFLTHISKPVIKLPSAETMLDQPKDNSNNGIMTTQEMMKSNPLLKYLKEKAEKKIAERKKGSNSSSSNSNRGSSNSNSSNGGSVNLTNSSGKSAVVTGVVSKNRISTYLNSNSSSTSTTATGGGSSSSNRNNKSKNSVVASSSSSTAAATNNSNNTNTNISNNNKASSSSHDNNNNNHNNVNERKAINHPIDRDTGVGAGAGVIIHKGGGGGGVGGKQPSIARHHDKDSKYQQILKQNKEVKIRSSNINGNSNSNNRDRLDSSEQSSVSGVSINDEGGGGGSKEKYDVDNTMKRHHPLSIQSAMKPERSHGADANNERLQTVIGSKSSRISAVTVIERGDKYRGSEAVKHQTGDRQYQGGERHDGRRGDVFNNADQLQSYNQGGDRQYQGVDRQYQGGDRQYQGDDRQYQGKGVRSDVSQSYHSNDTAYKGNKGPKFDKNQQVTVVKREPRPKNPGYNEAPFKSPELASDALYPSLNPHSHIP